VDRTLERIEGDPQTPKRRKRFVVPVQIVGSHVDSAAYCIATRATKLQSSIRDLGRLIKTTGNRLAQLLDSLFAPLIPLGFLGRLPLEFYLLVLLGLSSSLYLLPQLSGEIVPLCFGHPMPPCCQNPP
jgi:hypothetical protein